MISTLAVSLLNNPQVIHTDQDFRVVTFTPSMDYLKHTVCVEHYCPDIPPKDWWSPFVVNPTNLNRQCPRCKHTIPEGLQAVFWFMQDEISQKTPKSHIKRRKNRV